MEKKLIKRSQRRLRSQLAKRLVDNEVVCRPCLSDDQRCKRTTTCATCQQSGGERGNSRGETVVWPPGADETVTGDSIGFSSEFVSSGDGDDQERRIPVLALSTRSTVALPRKN